MLKFLRPRSSVGLLFAVLVFSIPAPRLLAVEAPANAPERTPAEITRSILAAPYQFIAPTAIDFKAVIPPPPSDDSPAGRADLATVLQLQSDRTKSQVKRAERVAAQTVFTFAAPALGKWFTPKKLPQTEAFFKIATTEEYAISTLAKLHFNRPRPMGRDPHIQPVTGRSRSASYPSGHASDAAMWAVILGEIFPDHRAALADQLREVMWSRSLAGSHYPSDTQAGQILGEVVAREMLKSPALQTALAAVRSECLAAAKK